MVPRVALPDSTRCRRHDGRDWRCRRPVMEGKLFCEIHRAQNRLRSERKQVPDSLLLRKRKKKKEPAIQNPPEAEEEEAAGGDEFRVLTGREHLGREKKRIRVPTAGEELLKGLEIVRNRRTAAARSRKKLEKKKKKNVVSGEEGDPISAGEEVTRNLPYGRMAISPALVSRKGSASAKAIADVGPAAIKLGLNPEDCRLVNPRFRSKNIPRPPISTVKVLPFAKKRVKPTAAAGAADVIGGGRKKCHWCQRAKWRLVKCLSCKKLAFCPDCIKERSIDKEDVKSNCPVCRGLCNCQYCLASKSKDVPSQEILKDSYKFSKSVALHYLIHWILPVLNKINEDQTMEMEIEAKTKGQSLSQVEIRHAKNSWKDQVSCDRCNSPILDLHRSCSKCSYNLCLNCCRESRGVPGYRGLSCLSKELGGCGHETLGLVSVLPFKWIKELEINARQTISGHETPKEFEDSSRCSICADLADGGKEKDLVEASKRSHSEDNLLYHPSAHDDHDIMLVHFQKHWKNVHPVIVGDVLQSDSTLSWDPVSMFSHYIEIDSAGWVTGKGETMGGVNCSDWYEAEFHNKESFTGSLLKAGMQVRHETMKLMAMLSPVLFQKAFPDHSATVVDSLPLQEYTSPNTGLLNLIANSPEEPRESKMDMSPSIHISCGSPEEVKKGKLVTALSCKAYDLVNVLSHASDLPCTADQIDKIKALTVKNSVKDARGTVDGQNQENGMAMEQNVIVDDPSVQKSSGANILPNSEKESGASIILCSGRDSSSFERTADPVGACKSMDKDSLSEKPCGVQWDVFRREDTPKLREYIQRHKNELYSGHGLPKEVVHPILDGRFFLNSLHKLKLKEEFQIEPWTFDQCLGEAVIIPAGCVYQTRNLKSCVNVVLGFISPESASECIKLNEELCALSKDHKAKQGGFLEVEMLAVHKMRKAIDEMNGEPSTMPPLPEM